jgi:hypothetical protein
MRLEKYSRFGPPELKIRRNHGILDRCGLANVVLPREDLQSDHESAAWTAGTIPACGVGDPGGSNHLAVGSTSHRSIARTFRDNFPVCFLRELVL